MSERCQVYFLAGLPTNDAVIVVGLLAMLVAIAFRRVLLLACYRYIDLNPVRAAMVVAPDGYEWSSYRHHITPSDDNWLDQSDAYKALGSTDAVCATLYSVFVSEGIEETELDFIRTAVKRNQVTGTTRFKEKLAERTGRRISSRSPGRLKTRK